MAFSSILFSLSQLPSSVLSVMWVEDRFELVLVGEPLH